MKKILAIVLLSLLIFSSCNKADTNNVTDTQAVSEIETETETDIETMSDRELVDWGDVIRYNGALYWNIYSGVAPVADGKLGEVEYSIIENYENGVEDPTEGIGATFLNKGTNVYACKGYSPEYRICARGFSFNIYERRNAGNANFSSLLPSSEQIQKISVRKNSDIMGELIGSIYNREHINEIYSLLLESEFTDSIYGEPQNSYYIGLEFIDGTVAFFGAYDHGFGDFIDNITIPLEFFDLLISYIE